MTDHTALQLLVQLPLHADEGIVSFVQRHCEANYVARMLDMLRLVGDVAGEPVKDVRDIVRSRPVLRGLETLTGLAEGSLDNRFVAPVQSTHLRVGHHYWSEGQRRADAQAVCPTCLAESGYARTDWEFVQAPVCRVHNTALLESCPACTKPLRHRRARLMQCGECGSDLRLASSQAVSAAAAEAAGLVQRPAMVPMGDPDSTAPIDQEELSALLRLCVPASLGQGTSYGLTEPLERLPVAARLGALENLGHAWVERRIDSARLRAQVLGRWMSASLLPQHVQLELLATAAVTVELPGDVLRLLCHGSDAQRVVPAAVHFDGRPPQLLSTAAVADYLGIDEDALRALRGRDGLDSPPEGLGYDMDQVMRLERTLRTLLTPQEVDQVTGVDGLVLALLDLKLLAALRSTDGTVIGIRLDSLELLLSGIQEKVDQRMPAPASAVPLWQALSHGTELQGVAWMVSQARGGSLGAYAWPAPHRLLDLVVDEARLRSLEGSLSVGAA
jgi:TniQ